ncbi:aminotransferase, class V [Chytriomyces cf. hyalinus JEL632]|nr:aminotransferase, class V [Chytriomyces cf. hyalinus JEL632]
MVRLVQCDQTASSIPLKIIEDFLSARVYPFYTNTHSNNVLGQNMSRLFADAKRKVMSGLNASTTDYSLIFTGSGCSGAVNHLIHLIRHKVEASTVIVSEAEHYSNLLPWFHVAKRVILLSTQSKSGIVNIDQLDSAIRIHLVNGPVIVSMTACSNVTGAIQPVEGIARVCREWKVPCFFDYATSGPYVPIDLTRDLPDAVFLSSHKFPGGPSGPGILVVKKTIVDASVSYTPGGGTVQRVSSKTGPVYSEDLETRETGGTPNILGIIRTGLAFEIKSHYIDEIWKEELALTRTFQSYLDILPIFAFQVKNKHPNLVVALLSDEFGVTTRGGVSCAGVFAEKLLALTDSQLREIASNSGSPWWFGSQLKKYAQ